MLLTGLPSVVWLPNSQIPIAPGVNGIVASASSVTGCGEEVTYGGYLYGRSGSDGYSVLNKLNHHGTGNRVPAQQAVPSTIGYVVLDHLTRMLNLDRNEMRSWQPLKQGLWKLGN